MMNYWNRYWPTVKGRWTQRMPKFFKGVSILSALVGGTALAVQTAIVTGMGTPHEWWQDIYPYLVGGSAGALFVSRFTVNGGFRGDMKAGEKDIKYKNKEKK